MLPFHLQSFTVSLDSPRVRTVLSSPLLLYAGVKGTTSQNCIAFSVRSKWIVGFIFNTDQLVNRFFELIYGFIMVAGDSKVQRRAVVRHCAAAWLVVCTAAMADTARAQPSGTCNNSKTLSPPEGLLKTLCKVKKEPQRMIWNSKF